MNQWLLYALSGACWFAIGMWGLFTHEELVRKILAVNVAGSGLFLVFIAVARRAPGDAADPVPQALVLTGIVVSISATALALAIARRLSDAEQDEAAQPQRSPRQRDARES